MYKIVFFVPVDHLDRVKSALFDAGAGKLGSYDCCAWQTLGQGQFRPLEGSQPHIGEQGCMAVVDEYRVEMVCSDHCVRAAVAALRASHPYEEPAFDIWSLAKF